MSDGTKTMGISLAEWAAAEIERLRVAVHHLESGLSAAEEDRDRLRADVQALRSPWQPIETAPKDGTEILIFVAVTREQFVAYWDSDGWRFAPNAKLMTPTHWMPLPAPPTKETP